MTRREALIAAAATTLPAAMPGTAQAANVSFSGYRWLVRDTGGATEGPGPNRFDPANVAVVNGRLRLRVSKNATNQWTCAEVTMLPPKGNTLGYGVYRFTVSTPADSLPEDVTLGLFTWSDTKHQNLGEVDVELARWGNGGSVTNAQFVVQPYDLTDGRMVRFRSPPPPPHKGLPMVYQFNWQPNGIQFKASTTTGRVISAWYFSGPDLPKTSDERVHMNLWIFEPANATLTESVEVSIADFEFVKA